MNSPTWMSIAIISLIAVTILSGGYVFLDVWKRRVGRGIQENVRNFGMGLLLLIAAIGGVSYWLEGRQQARETQEALKAVGRAHEQERERQRSEEALSEINRHNEEAAAKLRRKLDEDMKRATDRLDALAKENQRRIDDLRGVTRGR